MDSPKSKLRRRVDYRVGQVTMIVGMAMFGGGALIILSQIGSWLKYGHWRSCPLLLAVQELVPRALPWFDDTTSWVGLKTLVAWVLITCPLSLVLIVCGFPMGVYGILRMEDAEDHIRRRSKEGSDRRLLKVAGMIILGFILLLLLALGAVSLLESHTYWPPAQP
jgi:hypothetical protein